MSTRLATGGRLIDRRQPLKFSFNGKRLTGYAGDTLASALLRSGSDACGPVLQVSSSAGAWWRQGGGAQRAGKISARGTGWNRTARTTTELFEGAGGGAARTMVRASNSTWGREVNQLFARVLPRVLLQNVHPPGSLLEACVRSPSIRQSAGVGEAPEPPGGRENPETPMSTCMPTWTFWSWVRCRPGLQAALTAGRAGKRVMLVKHPAHWGGSAILDPAAAEGRRPDRRRSRRNHGG